MGDKVGLLLARVAFLGYMIVDSPRMDQLKFKLAAGVGR